ncbi:SusC/RagA family TonB-linked outer membrane protein [Sphingobacterium arenae]|uniref:TonB-dependent receptor n=1 Tax=Sphingobacterium arenae TaxID=1280598 RepID=A0ABR7Y7S0_9SPHI|nr:TonB-dependent receptor [Sphingobacterium arenae]MBD1427353.1 TonB-dependent receptor [Sphingobacterium arenae]
MYRITVLTWALFLIVTASFGQGQNPVVISGVVQDKLGLLKGVTVSEKNAKNTTTSDDKGRFTITVAPGSTLTFQYIGYKPVEHVVTTTDDIRISMENDNQMVEEIVVVGYGQQAQKTMTGAVSAIKGEEIVTTKNESLPNMLTGKIPGLRVVQNSAEPGQFNNSMDIRGLGSPLIIIDGVPRNNMARLNPEDIESISVLKDASAAIYGVNSANGVILITTKKGAQGEIDLSYSGSMLWQRPSNFPKLVDAVDWMTLYNERSSHNVDNPTRPYTDEQIEQYRSGELKSTDWVSAIFRNSAPQQMHTLNASGGSDRISFYSSLGLQKQESFLRTNAINYEIFNLRSNISAKITDNLVFDMNLAGTLDDRQSTPYSSSDIIRGMWLMQPMDRVFYDDEQTKYWQPSNGGLQNPAAMMDSDLVGKNEYRSKWFQSNFSLRYDAPFLDGLYVKGLYSYDYTLNENKEFSKAYQLYDSGGNPRTWNAQSDAPNRVARYFYGKDANLWNVQIGYEKQFEDHFISSMALFENTHREGDNFYGSRQLALPLDQIFAGITDKMQINQSVSSGSLYDYAYHAYVGRLAYNYKSKYLSEFTYRYESSSRFSGQSGWAGTPAVMAGWVISEEDFMKNSSLNFINLFKVRASYGRMLDDAATNDYNFLTGYYYPATGGSSVSLPSGYVFDGNFINSSSDKGIANRAITWYKSDMFNLGLDFDAWTGKFGGTLELFQRKRHGLLATRSQSLPGIVGAAQPQENLNSDLTRGIELELYHADKWKDLSYRIAGNISYTRVKTLHFERARAGNSYLNWRQNNNQRYNNIWWGYAGDGIITDWDDLYYNTTYISRGSTLGDYQYLDWNGDGQISDLDVHPLAVNGMVPLINYGITLSASWKGIDLNMLWQGAGKRYFAAREFLYQPLWSDTNALTEFLNRWRPTNPEASPYDPATEWIEGDYAFTGTNPNYNSEFNIQNAAYIRLKSIELGYSLPSDWLTKVNLKKVRLYVNAYNLLTFTKLRYMDPEFYSNPDVSRGGLGDYGYSYPLNKTISVGLNVNF